MVVTVFIINIQSYTSIVEFWIENSYFDLKLNVVCWQTIIFLALSSYLYLGCSGSSVAKHGLIWMGLSVSAVMLCWYCQCEW